MTMGKYTSEERQRILLRARRALDKANRDNPDDYNDFMDQCISQLEDEGVDDPESVCQMIWEEQGD